MRCCVDQRSRGATRIEVQPPWIRVRLSPLEMSCSMTSRRSSSLRRYRNCRSTAAIPARPAPGFASEICSAPGEAVRRRPVRARRAVRRESDQPGDRTAGVSAAHPRCSSPADPAEAPPFRSTRCSSDVGERPLTTALTRVAARRTPRVHDAERGTTGSSTSELGDDASRSRAASAGGVARVARRDPGGTTTYGRFPAVVPIARQPAAYPSMTGTQRPSWNDVEMTTSRVLVHRARARRRMGETTNSTAFASSGPASRILLLQRVPIVVRGERRAG